MVLFLPPAGPVGESPPTLSLRPRGALTGGPQKGAAAHWALESLPPREVHTELPAVRLSLVTDVLVVTAPVASLREGSPGHCSLCSVQALFPPFSLGCLLCQLLAAVNSASSRLRGERVSQLLR